MIAGSFDWLPSRSVFRVFGVSLFLTGLAIAALLRWQFAAPAAAWAVLAATALGGVMAAALPRSWPARVVYWVVALPAFAVGSVMSVILVSGVYYLLVTPIGLGVRLTRRDPLGLRDSEETFWRTVETPDTPDHYERQF